LLLHTGGDVIVLLFFTTFQLLELFVFVIAGLRVGVNHGLRRRLHLRLLGLALLLALLLVVLG